MNMVAMKEHLVESPVTYIFDLHLKAGDYTKFNYTLP